MDLNRSSSSEDEPTSPTTPPQSTASPPLQNASAEQKLPQPQYPPQPPHPPSQPQQPPQSSGSLLCQELLSVCNNDYAAQQLSAARKTSDPLTLSPLGPNARLLAPPTTSGSAGASNSDPVLLKLQAGLLQANVPEAKRVRQVKAAERLQPKISPPAPDVLKMLQVPRGESPDLPTRMPAGSGRRFRRAPQGAHAAQ